MRILFVWLVGACLLLVTPARGDLVGAAVIPHGDQAFDTTAVTGCGNGSVHDECVRLNDASTRAGKFVASSLKPDVIFLTTPHGLELGSDFMIYENSNEAGAAPVGDVPHSQSYTFPLNFTTSSSVAEALLLGLRERGLRVQGLRGFSDAQPLPVSWGEILPLSFIWKANQQAGLMPPPVVVMSVPYRRFNHSSEMVAEMVAIGGAAAAIFESRSERIAWVVSSDLAHTHLASGPYGYCPCAQPFDDAVGRWLTTLKSYELLVNAAKQQRLGAASCGFTGLVLLEGGLAETQKNHFWKSELLANDHPTYYGMGVGLVWGNNRFPREVLV